MAEQHLHCHECGRRCPASDRARRAQLHCPDCGAPLQPEPPPERPPDEGDPFEGRTVGGAALRRRISRRPGCSIYEAGHGELKMKVRVTVIPTGAEEKAPRWLADVLERSAAARQVHSRHVLGVLDVGRLEDCYFVVTESAQRSLSELAQPDEGVEPRRVLPLLEGMLRGLAALHEQGTTHGDVRPQTVLLARDGTARLDRPGPPHPLELNGLTVDEDGDLAGAALYVAPESAADRRRADTRSDIYSAGAVALRLLSGRPPVEARSAEEAMRAHIEGNLTDLRRLRPDLPEPLVRLLRRLTARDPEHRPATARQAIEELLACGRELEADYGLKLSARPPEERGLRWTTGWTVVAVVLILATIAPFAWLYRRHAARQAALPRPHGTVLLVRPHQMAAEALSDEQMQAAVALLRYRLAFHPSLELLEPGDLPRGGQRLERALDELDAAHLLLAAHGPGLGRRRWTLVFAHRGDEPWTLTRTCAVPEGGDDYAALEEAAGDLLAEAAGRLELPRQQPGPTAGGGRRQWAALARTARAELDGRWREALSAAEHAPGPAGAFLRAYYGAALSAEEKGALAPTEAPPEEGLPPEMAAIADVLQAMGTGEEELVRQRFGACLSQFPRSARGYFLLGLWRLHELGLPDEAFLAFRQAARSDPDHLAAARACVDVLVGRRPEKLAEFLKEYEDEIAAPGPARILRQRARLPGGQ
ncbi:MAG: serine/threonine-protein kinase [Candidatus Brocadiia bacterium]